MSNTLPWRTLATPPTPSDFSAPSIALPCGSSTPDFNVTVTRAFIEDCSFCTRRLGEIEIVVDIAQRQRDPELRKRDDIVPSRQSPFGKTDVARKDHDINGILRNDDIVGQ